MTFAFDPELSAVLPGMPVLDLADVEGTRMKLNEFAAAFDAFTPDPGVDLRVLSIPGLPGNPPVEAHVLVPRDRGGRPAPVLLWFHGGGFVLGDARESLPFLQEVTMATGAITVSLQQRLAPEWPYPAAIDDGLAALNWLASGPAELHVDPQHVVVGGASAGGAQAAGLVLRARDEGGPRVAGQILDIPVIDDRVESASAVDYVDTPVWNRSNAFHGWHSYLADVERPVPSYAAPGRAEDLSGLPPTIITVNQFDPLRDDAISYAQRLAHANVPTELHLYPGTFHGSASLVTDAGVSKRQLNDLKAAAARMLAADNDSEVDRPSRDCRNSV